MGKVTGFKEFTRQTEAYRDINVRIADYDEIFSGEHNDQALTVQGARCMDCGVPFCQSATGCPVDNLIPEFNDLVYQNRWFEAYKRLNQTNNFPEFTGRVCPAPCEGACVLSINEPAVTIKNIEAAIADKAFDEGWVKIQKPHKRRGQKVAIVGSGPTGLAAADELNKKGYQVCVFERDDRMGGLLMYGIPNMKLGKDLVERRILLLQKAGVEFTANADIGRTHSLSQLSAEFDAVLLATGATQARDLSLDNRQIDGVHLAMEYLTASTKALLEHKTPCAELNAKGKDVIVIGGGDTGTDCIATALRQGARSIVNFELMAKPPNRRAADNPWPQWPLIYRVDYGHEEAASVFGSDVRNYQLMTKRFVGKNGRLTGLETVEVAFKDGKLLEKNDTKKYWNTDLVLLSMGFISPEHYVLDGMNIALDARQNYHARYGDYNTSEAGVFAAGDCRRGQSLVVWAIHEGRQAAEKIHEYLCRL